MGDAVREGEVVLDPERTIDAGTRVETGAPPLQASPPAADYAELTQVERGHYVVLGEIATGGMGRVLEARDLRLGRQVAIKELLPRNRDAARRFEREARITARLQHPGIVHVYEAGVWPGGEPFYAMPKVPGRSLDKVVAERATLAERLGLVLSVRAVADAIAYAHSERVIHRDLKPANVLVAEFGQTVVIDWGLAKDLAQANDPQESLAMQMREHAAEQTVSGSVVGTPAYMPPEQARGQAVDQRADVYAIGALLYKVLCGHAPYVAETSSDILELVKAGPPVPIQDREPGAPRELVAIVDKAMAREPRQRYADAGELAADLERFETGQLVAAHRYTRRQLVWRFVRRHRVAIVIGAIALAVLTIGADVSVQRILDEKRHTEAKRFALLEERGRAELAEGRAGPAFAYLVNAAHDRETSRARAFLLEEAIRPFQAEQRFEQAGTGPVRVAVHGDTFATAADVLTLWQAVPRVVAKQRFGAVAFDHAGHHLAAGDDNGAVRIWPVAGGNPVELTGHGAILDLTFSGDDRRIAAAGADGAARVWDVATGTLVATTDCHDRPVLSVRFSPDGTELATASEDASSCVWSVENDRLVALLRGHSDRVRSARWSADGKQIVTASDDGTARVWNELGKPLVTALRHEKAVVAAELAPDGETVVTASSDHTARVWRLPEATTPLQDARIVAKLIGHTDAIVDATLSPDGTRLATAGLDRLANVWDVQTGQLLATFEHPDVVSDLVFADDRRLITGDRGGVAHVWDMTLGIARDRRPLRSQVHAVAVAPGELAAGTEGSLVVLWRGDQRIELRGHLGRVHAVAFTHAGQRLVSAGDDRDVIVWDTATGQETCRIHHDDELPRRTLAAAGDLVAIAAADTVELWSTIDCKRKDSFEDRGTTIGAVAASGTLIAVGAGDGTVVVRDERTGDQRSFAAVSAGVTALAFSPDGTSLVVACDGDAKVIAVDPPHRRLALDGPFGSVTSVGWLDDARVATASRDGSAKIWDAAKGKLLGKRGAPGAAISSMAIDGSTMWLGSEDGTASAWDVSVLTETVEHLDQFLEDKVPWTLGDDDVVRRSTRSGAEHGQH